MVKMSSPFVLQIKNKPCLVIGGGTIAERKIIHLLKEQASVTVISPTLTENLKQQRNAFTYKETDMKVKDTDREGCDRLDLNWRSFFLVVIATDSFALNEKFATGLTQYVSLINVVDNQQVSSFFFPSVIERGKLKVAVTTSGASPILSKKITRHIAKLLGPEYGEYVDQLAALRRDLQKREINPIRRKELLEASTPFPLPDSQERENKK
ncbi:hypothetical protein CR194_19045 [Salipaludibacillus keqinensis]|uniref:precorrin-2 dehydrogenase n=2 Tax=Salipaludibacillus keqinensis TaxID=2045207 RepID=A0A323T7X7_9BACI|nr:hypothetical protein CR194_19045 [Salipaludibacillus keqinensis]